MVTVPISGLYELACSISMAGLGSYASYEIIKNAEIVGKFYVDAEYNDEYRSSSMTAMLQVGDVLFVRTSSTYTPHGNVISNTYAKSSVAGWLIQ